jgi:hypothetical protein
MNEQPGDQRETVKAVEKRPEPRQDLGRQAMGAVIGGAAGLLAAMAVRLLGWGGENMIPFILWGSVVGATVSDIEALENAGRRLTRRDARWLNIAVALLGMVVVFAFIFGLANVVVLVIQRFTTP